MTERATAENAVSLSSLDGKEWTRINGEPDDAANVEGTVTRVVIGELGGAKEVKHGAELLQEALDHHGKSITHLHLWNLKKLDRLENLPLNLKCLDLRGCSALSLIPDLPETLESLDLDGCENLKDLSDSKAPELQYLHLGDCKKLTSATINKRIGASPRLKELTLSNCTQLYDLAELAQVRSPLLRKVVLKGCEKLGDLPDLSVFERLNHLNFNGCSSLEELPKLPILEDSDPPRSYNEPILGLRYLVAHGCDSLREYQGLDLRPVHLSDHDDDNIIDTLRVLEHLGQRPETLLSSKLLLLGSGRVGKTTLAKALQWADLDEDERETEDGKKLNPCLGSPSTHGIQFWPWECEFNLSPFGKRNERGQVHIWDFAGQEIYHNTHRLFAASGTVFVIVCCDPKTHKLRLEEETKEMSPDDRKKYYERNSYRRLKYWLDYVRSAVGLPLERVEDLPVILVHSAERTSDCNYLREEAGPYKRLIGRVFPLVCLKLSKENYVDNSSFATLKRELAALLGPSADQQGIRVPAFYKKCHEVIQGLLGAGEPEARHAALNFQDWCKTLESRLRSQFPSLAFQQSAMLAVTRYLHRIGQLFWLEQDNEGDVLVDQQHGARAIYALYTDHAEEIQAADGLINDDGLAEMLDWHLWHHRMNVARIRQLLVKCEICVDISDGRLQALSPGLLPTLKADGLRSINSVWFSLMQNKPGYVNHCFQVAGRTKINKQRDLMIGSADMQAVMAWLARSVRDGKHGRGLPRFLAMGEGQSDPEFKETSIAWRAEWKFWRNGVQIAWHPEFKIENHFSLSRTQPFKPGQSAGDAFLLRVQYSPFVVDDDKDVSYDGGLYVELLTRDEDNMSQRLRSALFSESGPLFFLRDSYEISDTRPENHPSWEVAYPRDAAMWPWKKNRRPGIVPATYDVAISVRGVDVDIARELYERLTDVGFNTYGYFEDEKCRPRIKETESSLLDIYKYLDLAESLVIICSQAYLEKAKTKSKWDKAKGENLFCPVELAAAICSTRRKKKPRRHSDIVILVLEDERFKRSQLNDLVDRRLRWFESNITRKRKTQSKRMRKERKWVEKSLDGMTDFLDQCAEENSQVITWDRSDTSKDEIIASVVSRVQRARSGD